MRLKHLGLKEEDEMKILTVVGTRPNFTKEYAMSRALKQKGLHEVLLHTGQHYDYEMSQTFFEGLYLPTPKYINQIIKSGFHGDETAAMLMFIEQVLLKERPDVTLVYGDVNSTVAAALASVKLHIPVAHVEAGLRCEHFYNPEEINRRVTDSMSELLFPHIQSAYHSLIQENYPPDRIVLPGDIVMDSLLLVARDKQITPTRGDYHLMTLHRAENTNDPQKLESIVTAVIESGARILFLVHPRTKKALVQNSLMDRLHKAKNIEVLGPEGFVSFVKLLAGAHKVITDSGGVRREGYIFGKPVINISDFVWVPEMMAAGWSLLVGADRQRIVQAIHEFEPTGERPPIFGDGNAAEKIAAALVHRFGGP
ncbi:MAG: UDP-N-acetylglucosamine 2-epimerase (non-hydrolyzing) [Magnetococcales bacterium]|nr:UDP-N-acetylglucosamine 2-epimerase (non-hydrolyzing) [Magnetococcales bacterium]